MKLCVSNSKISGTISVPGSKSHTIRAVLAAFLADGESCVQAPLISEDTLSALKAASELGAVIKRGNDSEWKISGLGGRISAPKQTIDLGNSGTALRLFTALAALGNAPVSFDGDESLRTRKMLPLLDALQSIGAKYESADGKCPLTVQGPIIGGKMNVDGKTSQYLSALLFAVPLCQNDSQIEVNNLHEKPYVEITLDWLQRLGIRVEHDADLSRFFVPGKQSYPTFSRIIPADFSSAAFPAVAGAIAGEGLLIKNLDFSDKQGDKEIFNFLEQMGAKIRPQDDGMFMLPSPRLHAADFDLNATPDLLPVLAVAAATAQGVSVFRNVPQARMKETDRIECMAVELAKMGISVEQFEDGMAITGGILKSAAVESYKDHRIAMSLAIAGLVTQDGGCTIINDAECADVTYQNFAEEFHSLGANFEPQK